MGTVTPDPEGYALEILHAILEDSLVGVSQLQLRRDQETVSRRTKAEGLSFLTKTLPQLGAAVDLGLSTGLFRCPTSFHRMRKSALPAFLQGLLTEIFRADGTLLPVTPGQVAAVADVRQVCYALYKAERPFTESQLRTAEKNFRHTDSDIGEGMPHVGSFTFAVLCKAQEALTRLFDGFDPFDITPSHGPGIVADGMKPHEKRMFRTKYKDIHDVYPYYRWFYVNPHHLLSSVRGYRARAEVESGVNKVLFVPKDSRGPRTIACEPVEYQYLQQGLRKSLYRWVENHPLTRGKVNFDDQTINQRLALEGSIATDRWSTIDLKDASDRVSVWLVRYLFSETPLIRPLLALRSPRSRLPDGSIVTLNKYAAMGSALCFPIEALVFWALIDGICAVRRHVPQVYVYGDDIICRPFIWDDVLSVFSELRLVVNVRKSFHTGPFKESCGHDYYAGHLVTPTRVRTLEWSSPADLASLVSTANQLFARGYHKGSLAVERRIRKFNLPTGHVDSQYLCFYSPRSQPPLNIQGCRWNRRLHRWERRVRCVTGTSYSNPGYTSDQIYAEYARKVTQGWSPDFEAGAYAIRHRLRLTKSWVDIHK